MWEPNEQLLLRAPTRYKKNEGTLYVTPRRVAWQQQGSAQLNPSISYVEIGSLAQTPETSPKVLLKITTVAPAPKDHTFQFTSAKALTEREAIKSQITELLARTRGSKGYAAPASIVMSTPASSAAPTPSPAPSPTPTVSSPAAANGGGASIGSPKSWRQEEFNARKKLLSSSRELHTLHMELVVTGKNVTEEEFWASPYVKRIRQKLKQDPVAREGKQKGKSSKMVELMPGQQEGSDVKYTLTSQIIHNIFTEFPSVKRAYDANVPDKLSEQQFWKRFLASEFFHRSRTGGRSQTAAYDDIFDKCLQEEDEENSKAPELSRMDKIKRAIDLTATQEDHIESGNAPDFTMKAGGNAGVLPLIRRFNRHAMRVLETPSGPILSKNSKRDTEMRDADDLEEETVIPDLRQDKPPDRVLLDITDSRRYFESQSGGPDMAAIKKEDAERLLYEFKEHFEHWQPDLTKSVMRPQVADKVCQTLTHAVKRKAQHAEKISKNDIKLPPPIQQKVQSYHSATNEILRHFWSSFEPYKEEKNTRMVEALKKQKEKLKEVLITVQSYKGDVDRCKLMLSPVLAATEKALEISEKRKKRRKL
ncbi:hypothetical protein VTP01DRAFT_1885 [Rhizomucor pusillus]|uniref:uncharacterized protein n=1 Tax=Rhizomucor pusillus TaxID=4840 RepID=UPI0037438675